MKCWDATAGSILTSAVMYVSDAHHSTSWLDHVICSSNMHSAIGGINVVDKLPSSDHLPLVVTFSMKVVDSACVTSAHVNRGNEACQTTDWSNATANCMLMQLRATGYSGMYAFQMRYCANT